MKVILDLLGFRKETDIPRDWFYTNVRIPLPSPLYCGDEPIDMMKHSGLCALQFEYMGETEGDIPIMELNRQQHEKIYRCLTL